MFKNVNLEEEMGNGKHFWPGKHIDVSLIFSEKKKTVASEDEQKNRHLLNVWTIWQVFS